MRRLVFLLVAVTVLVCTAAFSTACGSSGQSSPGTAPAAANTIVIKNFMFSPMNLTVSPGTTVTVRNEDTATHTVTATDGAFNTGDIAGGSTKTFTVPAKPGSYGYICGIHQYMQGTLTVK